MPSCSARATAAHISQSQEFRHASRVSVLSTGGEGPQVCVHQHAGAGMLISQAGLTVGCRGLLHLTTPSCHSISRMGWDYLYFTGEEVEA